MSSSLTFSSLVEDKEKVSLDEFALFDKVINLRLAVRNAMGRIDEFIIRSDFEFVSVDGEIGKLVSGDTGFLSRKGEIRKVQHKPSIKVQYKQVNNTTSINIDIFIQNFYINTPDGQLLMSFNSSTFELVQVDIQMGYFNAFKKRLGANENLPNWGLTPSQLYDDFDRGATAGIDTITINVSYVNTEKLPPDSTLHIHGYVGNTIEEAVDSKKEDDKEDETIPYADLVKQSKEIYADKSKPMFQSIFDYYITRRFLKKSISKGFEIKPIKDNNKVMTESFARKNGVRVILSEEMNKLSVGMTRVKSTGNEAEDYNFAVLEYTNLPLGGIDNNISSAIEKIKSLTGIPFQSVRMNNGDIFVYLIDEYNPATTSKSKMKDWKRIEKMVGEATKEINKDTAFEQDYKNCLPAVYNITTDAYSQTMIVCPFCSFINPLQKIQFATRYALSSLVSYYANFTPVIQTFLALQISVSFATTEQINEMQIMATPETGGK